MNQEEYNMDYRSMGELIAAQRKEKDFTQRELANKLGVTDKAVSKWERGLSCPDIATIPQLAQLLGLTAEELLCLRREEQGNTKDKSEISTLIPMVLRAVGLAMGVAVTVLSAIGKLETQSAFSMLGIGLAAIGTASLADNNSN